MNSNTKYFKIPRGSETGEKFLEIEKRIINSRNEIDKFLDKYDCTSYSPTRWEYFGGIECVNIDNPDHKIWRKEPSLQNCLVPRLNTKKGKEIQEEMDALPSVGVREVNACIDWEEEFNSIGFSWENKEYYYISVFVEVEVPNDCIEVLWSEFNRNT